MRMTNELLMFPIISLFTFIRMSYKLLLMEIRECVLLEISLKNERYFSFTKSGIIYLTVVSSFLLDIINNYMLTINGTNYGIIQLGKSLIVLILLFLMKNRFFVMSFFSLLTVFFVRELVLIFNGVEVNFYGDLVVLFRFLFPFVYLGVFYEYRNSNVINRSIKLFGFIILIQSISIIFGYLFGIEYLRAYEWRDGYKGILYGINDVAFFMVMSYFYALVLFVNKKKIKYLIFFLIVATATLILGLGSRASLAGLIIAPYIYWFLTILMKSSAVQKLLYLTLNLSLIIVLYINLDEIINYALNNLFEQSLTLYSASGDFWTSFFSFRNVFMLDYFKNINSPFHFLFGTQLSTGREMIESEPFDFMLRFGFVGTLLYLLTMLRFTKNKDTQGKVEKATFYCLMLLLGFMMGHVLLSSINAPWVAMLLILFSKRFEIIRHQNGIK